MLNTPSSLNFLFERTLGNAKIKINYSYGDAELSLDIHWSWQPFSGFLLLQLCRMAAVKRLPVHRYSIVIFSFSGRSGQFGSDVWKQNTVKASARGRKRCCILLYLSWRLNHFPTLQVHFIFEISPFQIIYNLSVWLLFFRLLARCFAVYNCSPYPFQYPFSLLFLHT